MSHSTLHKTDTNRFTHGVLAAFGAFESSRELKSDMVCMPTAWAWYWGNGCGWTLMEIVHQEADIIKIYSNKSSKHCSCTLLAWVCYLDEVYYMPSNWLWVEWRYQGVCVVWSCEIIPIGPVENSPGDTNLEAMHGMDKLCNNVSQ